MSVAALGRLLGRASAATASSGDEERERMRKVEIVERVAAATDVTKTQAQAAIEAILAVIKEGLQQGEPVILRGLGTFAVHAKWSQMGRNPQTGTVLEIPAHRVVTFKAGKRLKQVVAAVGPSAVPARPSRRAVPSSPQRPAHSVPRRTYQRAPRARRP
jgi:DNA-binding protein HU-beta